MMKKNKIILYNDNAYEVMKFSDTRTHHMIQGSRTIIKKATIGMALQQLLQKQFIVIEENHITYVEIVYILERYLTTHRPTAHCD